MKKLYFLFFGLCIAQFTWAQTTFDFSKFTPLKSSGVLPKEVEMDGGEFILTSQKNIDKKGNRKDKKAKKQFVLESSYALKELFITGRLLFNDPISDYVEKVRLVVTASDPQLASETKVFVVKSPVVNAFATNQGYIFITTGLLAQLKNEAQLAFIICHELIHYKNKHAVNAYVESIKIDREEGAFRKSDIDKKIFDKANYSRENETEADIEGFSLYTKTNYPISAVDGVFDVLKYSEQPFDNTVFDIKGLLGSEYLVFPPDYAIDEVAEVEGINEDVEDKNSTHPNIGKRRAAIAKLVKNIDSTTAKGSNYIVSETSFLNIRKLARFDLCHTLLINRRYDNAIYSAYILLKDDPENLYLKKTILKGLYGLSTYANAHRLNEVYDKYEDLQGEQQRLNFLVDKLDPNELNVVALNYAWRLKSSLKSNDIEVDMITNSLFFNMVDKHFERISDFSSTPPPVAVIDTTTTKPKDSQITDGDKDDTTTLTPLKKRKRGGTKPSFINYAFVDLVKDSTFTQAYTQAIAKVKGSKILDTADPLYNQKNDCYALGVDKVLVLNPFYLKLDERKENHVLYEGSEGAQEKLSKRIVDLAGDAKLDIDIIDKKQFTTASVEDYNTEGILTDWLDERIDHHDLNILPTDYLEIKTITEKYGCEHIALMGTINFIEKKRGVGYAILISIVMPYFSWPITIPYMIIRKSDTYVYTVLYNLQTGQQEMENIGKAGMSDNYDIVGTFIYDHLKQIKRKTKNR